MRLLGVPVNVGCPRCECQSPRLHLFTFNAISLVLLVKCLEHVNIQSERFSAPCTLLLQAVPFFFFIITVHFETFASGIFIFFMSLSSFIQSLDCSFHAFPYLCSCDRTGVFGIIMCFLWYSFISSRNRLQNNTSVFSCVFFSDAETRYATMSGVVLCGNGITGNIKT